MATLTFGEKTAELPKFKIRELRAAAPFIDRAREKGVRLRPDDQAPLLEDMFDGVEEVLSVIAIGLLRSRDQTPYTAESIAAARDEVEGEMEMGQFGLLRGTFQEIMREAGMVREGDPTTAAPGTPGA